jgi:Fe-S cluster biogenesis protein NfuA
VFFYWPCNFLSVCYSGGGKRSYNEHHYLFDFLGHKLYTSKETQGRGIRVPIVFTVGDFMLEEQVKTALENVRPSLQADGGDVEFVSVTEDGLVSVKLTGACGGCPMAQMTLKMGIENYLKKEVPEVSSVIGV